MANFIERNQKRKEKRVNILMLRDCLGEERNWEHWKWRRICPKRRRHSKPIEQSL